MIFEHKISGIPCLIEVSNITVVKGSYSYNAASDLDYHGYTDFEYEVQDRRGCRADWLARKMSKVEKQGLEALITGKVKEPCDADY